MTKISDTISAFKGEVVQTENLLMKNLVRGGAILTLLGLFVVFIYAQSNTGSTLAIANDSQQNTIDNSISDNFLASNVNDDDEKDKKLVKKTALVTARGASRGAFSATAYCFTGRMANGQGVRRGMVAADPRVLRMGSRIVINAGPWSGTYTVADTGGSIKGKRLDIWVPGCAEARRFGRRSVEVFAVQ